MADKCEKGYTHVPSGATTVGCKGQCQPIFQLTGTKPVKVPKKDDKGRPVLDKNKQPVTEDKVEHTWVAVTPACRLVTRVEFKNDDFVPLEDQKDKEGIGLKCLCLIFDDSCKYNPTSTTAKGVTTLTAATCDCKCGSYYSEKPADPYEAPNPKAKLTVIPTMVIDHQATNQIRCGCWIRSA